MVFFLQHRAWLHRREKSWKTDINSLNLGINNRVRKICVGSNLRKIEPSLREQIDVALSTNLATEALGIGIADSDNLGIFPLKPRGDVGIAHHAET